MVEEIELFSLVILSKGTSMCVGLCTTLEPLMGDGSNVMILLLLIFEIFFQILRRSSLSWAQCISPATKSKCTNLTIPCLEKSRYH